MVAVAGIVRYKDSGYDYETFEVWWDLDKESPVELYKFEGDCKIEIENPSRLHQLCSVLYLVYKIKFGEQLTVELESFIEVPVKYPDDSYLCGFFQAPLFKSALT